MQQACFTIDVPHTHRETTADGHGHIWVNDPPTEETVMMQVDLEAIAKHYEQRACRAKGKRSRQLNGFVVVTKR